MGQPTAGIAQRTGYTQVWQHTPLLGPGERGFGDQQHRVMLGAQLSVLFFQSLVLAGRAHL
jgi:hypothetical protein